MKSKRLTLAALVVVISLLFSAFAFSAFSTELAVSGSVASSGSFGVYFSKPTGGTYNANYSLYNANDITVTVRSSSKDDDGGDDDKLTLDLEVPDSDAFTVTFPVSIYNEGTVAADVTVQTVTSGIFTVSATSTTIQPQEYGTINVTITAGSKLTQKTYTGITLTILASQQKPVDAPEASHGQHGQ